MLILKDIYYALEKETGWIKLSVTPEEIEQIKEYLNTIIPPVASGYIKLPFEMSRFFPMIWLHAVKFENEMWDTADGWTEFD